MLPPDSMFGMPDRVVPAAGHGLWLANILGLLPLGFAYGAAARYEQLQVPCETKSGCSDNQERLPPSGLRRLAVPLTIEQKLAGMCRLTFDRRCWAAEARAFAIYMDAASSLPSFAFSHSFEVLCAPPPHFAHAVRATCARCSSSCSPIGASRCRCASS
jgi:hypothetical protein